MKTLSSTLGAGAFTLALPSLCLTALSAVDNHWNPLSGTPMPPKVMLALKISALFWPAILVICTPLAASIHSNKLTVRTGLIGAISGSALATLSILCLSVAKEAISKGHFAFSAMSTGIFSAAILYVVIKHVNPDVYYKEACNSPP